MKTPLGIDITIGQLWEELDTRVMGRVIEVIDFSKDETEVYIRNVKNRRVTIAKLSRFNGKRSGYGPVNG